MTLLVIGSGFGRTGTASLKAALEMLDLGPSHHMEEVIKNPAQVPYWQDYVAGRPVDWNAVFAGYRSQVDWPGAHVWRELAATFPNAKIIHSTRPEEQWWKSFSATIGTLLNSYKELPLPPHMVAMVGAATEMIRRSFGGTIDRDHGLAAFRRREEEVRAAIPKERLIVFDVVQGWEPLCRFLGKPVPSAAFPRLNSTAEFWEMAKAGPH